MFSENHIKYRFNQKRFVLLLFIFLFFDKDFAMRFSVARSAFTTAEPPESHPDNQQSVISCLPKTISTGAFGGEDI